MPSRSTNSSAAARRASATAAAERLLRGRPDRSIVMWAILGFLLLWLLFTIDAPRSLRRSAASSPASAATATRSGRASASPCRRRSTGCRRSTSRTSARSISARPATETLMLTGDQNIVDIAYSVRWNIRDPELYLFELAEPDETIREVAESAMRAVVSGVTLNDAIGDGRGDIETRVAGRDAAGARRLSRGRADPGHRDQAGRSARRGQRRVQGSLRRAAGGAVLHQPGAAPMRCS